MVISGVSGTDSRQIRPSERQSNSAWPPRCDSMLAITLLVPNPRDAGFSTSGWLAVLLTFVLARVFAAGTLMREDLDGTV